jgi:hypothetical protein
MTTPENSGELQFESVVPRGGDGSAASADTVCTLCQIPIESEYFDVNGRTVCRACSDNVSRHATTPRDMATLVRALGAGVVASVFGAALYFAVLAISGFEIGLVAIAIGYMVGYAVHVGARSRGGRRFQVLALVLTYWAIGLAYSSLAIKELIADRPTSESASASGAQAGEATQPAAPATSEAPADAERTGDQPLTGGGFVLALLQLLAFTLVLPVLVIAGSMPGGLISGAIIVFGMLQAWKMTAAPALTISGPYRIATPAAG